MRLISSVIAIAGRLRGGAGRCGVLALVLSLAAPALRAAPGVHASLDRSTVAMGETVTLTLTFEDLKPPGEPNLPSLPSLALVGRSQSSQFSFENGRQTARQVHAFTLSPTQPGDVVIPPLQLTAGGRVHTTQPLPLKITPAAARPTNSAYLKLIVSKTEVYLGEPFEVEMQLYVQQAEDVKAPQLRMEGFSSGPMPQPQQSRTQIGGAVYNLVVWKLAAVAARTGPLNFGPAETSLTLIVPMPNAARDPFASFFGVQGRRQPATLSSEPVSMRVLPLPPNAPEGFNGAVGAYQLDVSVGPTNVAVGDPITVRARIAGRGRLEALALPEQPAWRDFKVYPPNPRLETTDPLGLNGAKHFEQVVIPENHEIKVLPSLRFSFFNPATRAYQTLSNRPVALSVRPAGVAATLLPALTNAAVPAPAPQDELVHIKPRLGAAARPAPLLAAQPWFLALQGVPPVAWLALRFWRRRAEAMANNPRLRRQREAARRVLEGLQELPRLAAERNAAEFFATLFRVLQEQLGERLDLPASAITEAVIDERLRPRQVPEPLLRALHDLFQACNVARYAPQQSSQELNAFIPRLEEVLRQLQRLPA